MNYVNPPTELPENVYHKTFYSQLAKHEIGYNIYLPEDYAKNDRRYPVTYYLHGWKGNESSNIWDLEEIYKTREAITVFVNRTFTYDAYIAESFTITEMIPYIDNDYRTVSAREGRMISGFSMGGGGAMYYAVKYPELFSSVMAYAGTFHHFYNKSYQGVGEPAEKARMLYEKMMTESSEFNDENILYLINKNADEIRGNLQIGLHVGTEDILICDNEILQFHLESLDIAHDYKKFEGISHILTGIL